MMQIPLPETVRESKVLPKQSEYLANLININGKVVTRPGMAQTTALAEAATPRGLWVFNGDIWGVWGDKLYKGTGLTEVGDIDGTAQVNVDIGFTQCAIAATSANYFINASDTLVEITDPDLPACRDVTRLDGRFIWTPSDGSVLAYSDVNDASSVDPLAFFDAETLPDNNLGTENVKNDLFVFGEQSIERFRNIGPSTAPFVRVNNSIVEVGLVGAKIKTKDSVIFLGRDRDNGFAFFIFSEGTAVPISDESINESLNTDYTVAELEAVKAQRFHWRGADCFVFSMPDKAYLFQGGKWSIVDSGTTGTTGFNAFNQSNAVLFGSTWYCQDENGLCEFSTNTVDYDGDFSRRIKTFARSGNEEVFTASYIELGVSQGRSGDPGEAVPGTIGLSLSKNGRLWSDPFYRQVSMLGAYDERLRFQRGGGLGRYDGYMGILFYITDDITVDADSMTVQL